MAYNQLVIFSGRKSVHLKLEQVYHNITTNVWQPESVTYFLVPKFVVGPRLIQVYYPCNKHVILD